MKKNIFNLNWLIVVVVSVFLFAFMVLPLVAAPKGVSKEGSCLLGESSVGSLSGVDIVRPRVNIPMIRKPRESFDLWCNNISSKEGLRVRLLAGKKVIPLVVKSVKFKKVVYDKNTGASYGCTVKVVVPKGVRGGLYDIQVVSRDGKSRNVRSVKIVPFYKKNFRFVQVTDTHIGVQDYQKYNPRLKGVLKAVASKKPEFIVVTGDCIHEACPRGKDASAGELWAEFLDYFKDVKIPVYVVPGNHDFRDRDNRRKEYNKYMGPRYYSFDYGDCRFLGLDNATCISRERPVTPEYLQQLKWADRGLAAHGGELKIIFQHVPYVANSVPDKERLLGVVQMPDEFLELCNKYSVDLLLDGHSHRNMERKFGKTPTLHLTTGTSSSNYDPTAIGKGWYRIVDVKNGKIKSAMGQR